MKHFLQGVERRFKTMRLMTIYNGPKWTTFASGGLELGVDYEIPHQLGRGKQNISRHVLKL